MIMNPPIEPNKEDCCNSGCNPCIFEVYEKQLLLYKKYQEEGNISESILPNAISQTNYTAFILKDIMELCEGHKLLTFRLKFSDISHRVTWNPGDHFLMKYKDESCSCTRAYTPLKPKIKNELDFSVIIKNYENGLVSSYLYNLNPGQETLWRGPYGVYDITPNKFHRIIMIAQGTGIAPFISIIENILENEDDLTKIILWYCCRNVNSIPLRNEIYSMKCYWNFTYLVFLSECVQDSVCKYQEPVLNHKLSTEYCEKFGPFSEKDQFLLCGSLHFMEHFKLWLEQQAVPNIVTF